MEYFALSHRIVFPDLFRDHLLLQEKAAYGVQMETLGKCKMWVCDHCSAWSRLCTVIQGQGEESRAKYLVVVLGL